MAPPAADRSELLVGRWGCLAGATIAPTDRRAILTQRTGVSHIAADGGEALVGRGRCWFVPTWTTCAPADGTAILTEPAREKPATADCGEPFVGRGRCLAAAIVSPANGRASYAERARMIFAAADSNETLVGRGRYVVVVDEGVGSAPADGSAVLS